MVRPSVRSTCVLSVVLLLVQKPRIRFRTTVKANALSLRSSTLSDGHSEPRSLFGLVL